MVVVGRFIAWLTHKDKTEFYFNIKYELTDKGTNGKQSKYKVTVTCSCASFWGVSQSLCVMRSMRQKKYGATTKHNIQIFWNGLNLKLKKYEFVERRYHPLSHNIFGLIYNFPYT